MARDGNAAHRLPGWLGSLAPALGNWARTIEKRSHKIPLALARNMDRITMGWMALFLVAAAPAVMLSVTPPRNPAELASLVLPYLLIAIAPVAGLRLTLRAFPSGLIHARPALHLSPFGRWQRVNLHEAQGSPDFGPAGFMASLLIGLLLNVVVRSGEFLVAVPALSSAAPAWGRTLFHVMAADVAVMGFVYMVCFVMALRSVPYFPKMLLFAWGLDILSQLLIARAVGPMEGLPVAVAGSLQNLLHGNITKVLISAVVWLPYLMLSDRVNITYRQRVRASAA
ncbi:MAG: DUF2569 domain-containing protein [Novosphingobium sp.]